ncbi:hypothetical protein J2S13_000462 [Oikeobacillus pervagus]|uniref:Uncharacterized protein n=1 Tax=Oikeobacillus pervagus TaxID=1325931 RepID=A0AAJ1WFL0_9BACI|nr:hypothetical protein [Oikeobacillus pervagus]MDQ0214067.1 hypothetical protein [Oikeobacillus pervagus]
MSEKFVSFTQIYKNPMYAHVKTSPNKLKRLKKEGLIEVIADSDGKDKVVLSSLEKYVQGEKKVFEQCFTIGQAARKLISHKYRFKSEFKLETYKNNIFNLMNRGILKSVTFVNETYITKESVNQFLLDYISREEALEKLNAGNITFGKILKRNNVNNIYVSQHHIFYPRQIVESLIEEYNLNVLPDNTMDTGTLIRGKVYNTELYYSCGEARKLLNLTKRQWNILRKEENITDTILGGIRHCLKEPIDQLRAHQQKLKAEYYISDEVQELLGLQYHSSHSKIIDARKKVPTVFRGIHPQKRIEYIYPKSIVNEIVQENELKEVVTTISDNIDAYEYVLESLEIKFHNSNSFTCKEWKKFVHRILRNTSESVETIHYTIFRYAKCTGILIEFLSDKELYELTSNHINLALFNETIPFRYQVIFYSFINSIYNKLIEKNKKKLLKLARIINPHEKEIIPKDKSIYDYQDYKSLFNFATNFPLHKRNAIEDVKKQMNQTVLTQNASGKIKRQKTYNYDSSWLYVLVHLNNAWRHKDVIRFPKIDLTELSVPNINLDWLEQNDLCYEDARRIIHQVMRKDLRTTKTNATNRFFCSKDVTLSLATVAVICELRRAATTPKYEYLINFNTIRNEFASRHKSTFFKGFNAEFIFENRKMNRSLLSYTYYLLVKKGHSQAALEVAQRLRAHFDFETTNIYIFIPEEELNNLTHQLFIREHFGYIPDLFAEVLFGNKDDREKRTKEILTVKQMFGDIYNIECTAGFLNTLQAEKKKVSDMILSMGFEEAADYMFKLDAQLLPSKEDDVQCLIGLENCIKHNIACRNCPMSVPNFYALSSLADSLTNRVQQLTSLEKEECKTEKTKIANIFSIEMDQWIKATEKFGKEIIYKFVEGGSQALKEKMKQISVADLNEYKTYNINKSEV